MSIVELLVSIGGAGILGALAWLWRRSSVAVKAKAEAEARERAATGSLDRERKLRELIDKLEKDAAERRRAREVADAGFQAQKVAAEQDAEQQAARTTEAASRGNEAMTDRANAAIREGRLPRGKPQ